MPLTDSECVIIVTPKPSFCNLNVYYDFTTSNLCVFNAGNQTKDFYETRAADQKTVILTGMRIMLQLYILHQKHNHK